MKEKLTGCFAAPKHKMALMSTPTVSINFRVRSAIPLPGDVRLHDHDEPRHLAADQVQQSFEQEPI